MKKILAAIVLFISGCTPAAAATIIAAGANNAAIQSAINSSSGQRVIFQAGSYTLTGVTCVNNLTIESDGPVIFNSATAGPMFDWSTCSRVSLRGDFDFVGNGPTYTGYASNGSMIDGAQSAIKLFNTSGVDIRGNIRIRNIAGNGIDAQSPAGAWQDVNHIDGVAISNCYRAMFFHNSAEYFTVSNFNAFNNVFGIVVESGNNTFVNGKTIFNSVGVRVAKGTGNDAHGVFSALESNHNTYNLSIVNILYGETFNASHFIADQSGSGHGAIQIINSNGVNITGGQIGSDITIDATSKVSIQSNYIRTDVASGPSIITGGVAFVKNNVADTGALWAFNN